VKKGRNYSGVGEPPSNNAYFDEKTDSWARQSWKKMKERERRNKFNQREEERPGHVRDRPSKEKPLDRSKGVRRQKGGKKKKKKKTL